MCKFMNMILSAVFILLLAVAANAQSQTATDSDSTSAASSGGGGEMIFDEIQIEGVIEKPNVTILRNRLGSDFETVDFVERSFEKEMLSLPDKDMLFSEDFESIGKAKNLKAILREILEPGVE